MQSQHSLKLTFSLQHCLEVNFLHCHIEFIQAWPALSLKPALSFGIRLKRKEVFWVTRITRTVTASGGGGKGSAATATAAASARSKPRANPPYFVHGSYRSGTQNRFTCAGAEHSCTPTSWSPQTTDRISGFSCKGPSSSPRLNLVWQQTPANTNATLWSLNNTPILTSCTLRLGKSAHVLL